MALTSHSISLKVAGTTANGGNAQFSLYVNGVLIAKDVDVSANYRAGEWNNFTFDYSSDSASTDQIKIVYANDAFNAATGEDRNFWVNSLTLDGREFQAALAQGATAHLGANAGLTSAAFFSNGSLTVSSSQFTASTAGPLKYLGVAFSGAEFSDNKLGDWKQAVTFPSDGNIDYYASKGLNILRLPVLWEQVQPTKGGAVDQSYIAQMHRVVDYAASKGMTVVIDTHDFGYAYGKLIGGSEITNADFANYWSLLAKEFKGSPNVMFGLMNEPNVQTPADWLVTANTAIAAIRGAGATQTILVPGSAWDGAYSWLSSGNAATVGAGVVDPLKNYAFEVHQYVDANASGGSSTTVSADIGVDRLKAITQWASTNGAKLFLGEVGVNTDPTALKALDNMLAYMSQHSDVWLGGTYWAAGNQNYFSIDPTGGTDRPQMDVLEKYAPASVVSDGSAVSYVSGNNTYYADGTVETRTYSATGSLDRVNIKHPNGSSEIYTYNIAGKDYVAEHGVFDASGAQLALTRSRADGSLVFAKTVNAATGAVTSDQYTAAGLLATRSVVKGGDTEIRTYAADGSTLVRSIVTHADASKDVWTYGITGKDYVTEHSTQNAAGVVTELTRSRADGTLSFVKTVDPRSGVTVSEQHGLDGLLISRTVEQAGSSDYRIYAADGVTLLRSTLTRADGSKDGWSYGITGKDYVTEHNVYSASGVMTELTRFRADGTVAFSKLTDAVTAAVSTLTNSFTSGGLLATSALVKADSTVLTKSYAADGKTLVQDSLARADGSREIHLYGVSGGQYSATGSDKADLIVGGAGDDRLSGGKGNDTLTGGAGRDTFVSSIGMGTDVITDFGKNGDADVLDLSAHMNAGIKMTVTADGADTLITYRTDVLRLVGVTPNQLAATSTGYVFAPTQGAATVTPPRASLAVASPAAAAATVTTVTNETPIALAWRAQNSGASYSYAANGNVNRFELHSGDRIATDTAGKERTEVYAPFAMDFGRAYHLHFDMMIEPGAANTAPWMTLIQMQSTADAGEIAHSPPFALGLTGDRVTIVTRSSQTAFLTVDDGVYINQYTDQTNITRGQWYKFDIDVTFDSAGQGHLKVVRDGVTLVDYTGALGYNDQVGPYLKQGIYRGDAPQSMAVNFRDTSLNLVTTSKPENTAPTNLSIDTLTVLENQSAGTVVGTASATDDKGQVLKYSLVGDAGGLFRVDANTGVVTTTASLDREARASYDVILRATSVAGLTTDKALTIAVADVNEAPKDVWMDRGTIAENQPAGTLVGTAHAIDPEGGALTYSLAGNSGGLFAINAQTGAITTTAALDYEDRSAHQLTIRVTDAAGATADRVVTIGVTNVNEAPTGLAMDRLVVAENQKAGTLVGTASATDPEGSAIRYSLVGADSLPFAINAKTGAVTTTAALDAAANSIYSLTIRAEDASGVAADRIFNVKVGNPPEKAGEMLFDNLTVAENGAAGTLVGKASIVMPVGGTISYSLVDDGQGLFKIDAKTGALTTTGSLDYEAKDSYGLTVRATASGQSIDSRFDVKVTDVAEAPTGAALPKAMIAENLAAGTLVGTATAVDPEGGKLGWSLVGAEGLPFKIDASTGAITTTASLDFEAKADYSLTVRATDASGLSLDRAMSVGVVDVSEQIGVVGGSEPIGAVGGSEPIVLGKSYVSIADMTRVDAVAAPPELTYFMTGHADGLVMLGKDYYDPQSL